jgi:hypothetical protein
MCIILLGKEGVPLGQFYKSSWLLRIDCGRHRPVPPSSAPAAGVLWLDESGMELLLKKHKLFFFLKVEKTPFLPYIKGTQA